MKRFALLLLLGGGLVPAVAAQELEHGQVGVYADYFKLKKTGTDFGGLGGRFALNHGRSLAFEAEMSYDFEQIFTETFTSSTGGIQFARSNIRVLHGLFGPKIQRSRGSIRPFLTVKGGIINFRFDPRPATLLTFTSSVDSLRSQDVNGVLYPGLGLEGHVGPLGLRLDAGDEIYFNSGTHHNLKVAVGPILRF